ncbi:MAG: phycocyanobilin:ferredoxin oxidoreductase [Cyanobacteriota bacterium]|nr:phycocyanobilin:ferredoxin oxidoreductase [Cyanobacteriota bacterium]
MLQTSNESLRVQQHPLIRKLADTIESVWERYLVLEPYYLPEELGYVEGRLEGEKLIIENRCYQSREFRKMHLELAKVGKSLDILHCVMFPRTSYALPMFGTDLVGARGNISAAIVDLSPTNQERMLPLGYENKLQELEINNFSQPRELPEWGGIFSDYCLFIKPTAPEEEGRFLSLVKSFLEIHCQEALNCENPISPEEQASIIAAQDYYCSQQQQNDKTRRVLEKAFGKEWAEKYMTTVLFDGPED